MTDPPFSNPPQKLTPLRYGLVDSLTQGGRELLRVVHRMCTPGPDADGVIRSPFGMMGNFDTKQNLILTVHHRL